MIEKIVLDYLNEKLEVEAYLEVPNSNTSTFLVIEKTGSKEDDEIKSATIAIQSYESSLYKAASLNKQVKEVMKNIVELDKISSCKLNSDYNFTDTQTKKYRYQAVFDITYY